MSPVTIDPPVALPDLQPAPDALALVLHERPIAQETLHSYLERVPRHVELVVGPEGGFSPREVETLLSRGFQPLYLGHVDWYVDYSHGIRLVRQQMTVEGVEMSVADVLADPDLHVLLSDEGVVTNPRY